MGSQERSRGDLPAPDPARRHPPRAWSLLLQIKLVQLGGEWLLLCGVCTAGRFPDVGGCTCKKVPVPLCVGLGPGGEAPLAPAASITYVQQQVAVWSRESLPIFTHRSSHLWDTETCGLQATVHLSWDLVLILNFDILFIIGFLHQF